MTLKCSNLKIEDGKQDNANNDNNTLLINPFQVSKFQVPLLYPLKMSENQRFFYVFRENRKVSLA